MKKKLVVKLESIYITTNTVRNVIIGNIHAQCPETISAKCTSIQLCLQIHLGGEHKFVKYIKTKYLEHDTLQRFYP
jgi:hypothetical protein